ncbi:MAG: molybdopterin-dependent oxidoreductase [Gammaproteobacteria bacterium]|nr:molybdopterin-dependent oxidoreductase [Gammaproteobacteria bacterium]
MGKWTRRAFITTGVVAGGGLVVGVALRIGHRAPGLAPLVTTDGETLVNAWVKVGTDNVVTAIVPHSEMGQGVHTSLAQMLADEMDADWNLVSMLEAPADKGYANYPLGRGFLMPGVDVPEILMPTLDGTFMQIARLMNLQITGGSASVRATGVYGMRVAGAAAREMLLGAAANVWKVPVAELSARQSFIEHAASNRRAPFAEFAEAAASVAPPAKPALKKPQEFQLMGKSLPRFDIPAKVDGSARFGIDAEVPGMKYASILRSPVFGGLLKSLDDGVASAMPGVQAVIELDNAVAVVADGYWQANQALQKVVVEWDAKGNETVSQDQLFARFAAALDGAEESGDWNDDVTMGDVPGAMAAGEVIEAEYRVPYLAHAPMEPLNATAWLHDDICEVWTSCQNPLGFRGEIAQALDLDDEKVVLHNAYLGGGFGRRAQGDYAVQAALVARAANVPVKLIWNREEDIRQDNYRPAVTSRFKAALNADGAPIAWENAYVDKHEPAEAPHIPYAVANQLIRYVKSPTHVPFGPWRSVDHSQHGFFTESFVDELARAAGKDSFEFRRDLLEVGSRERHVLELAAQKAGWGESVGEGRGRGIALQKSFGTIVAQVVDVTVTEGKVRVDRVVCAVDPGFAVSPDGLIAQMESGIVYGLTAALYGDIQVKNGAVVQSNFHDYQMLRMDEAPVIETHIINSGAAWGGAGEPGTPAIAPALTNAIFNATGTRIRQLPVKNYDLRYRIQEPEEVV